MTVEEIEQACRAGNAPAAVPHALDIGPLPFSATFYPMGFPLEIRTNAPEVLEMNSNLWHVWTERYDNFAPMTSEVYVAPGGPEECPPAPTYRYQRPLVTSIADRQHYVETDMERRRTWTSITRASLQHRLYLEYFFFALPLSTLPVNGMHAACVAWNGSGVLLCGDSGAGKSTLAYACARSGWEYVSDDMCALIDGPGRIVAGNSHLVRFRPTAAELFDEIRGLDLTPRAAGKPSIELATLSMGQLKRRAQVRIDYIVFLNRRQPEPAQLLPYRKDVARLYLSQGLYVNCETERRRKEDVEHLLDTSVLELRYSNLQWAVDRLRELTERGR